MKPSITTPFSATSNSKRHAVGTRGLVDKWFGVSRTRPSIPTANVYPSSLCRQALIDAIRQEKPHPEEHAALCWMLAESNRHWPNLDNVDPSPPSGFPIPLAAPRPEPVTLHASLESPCRDALSHLVVRSTPPGTANKPLASPRRRAIRNPVEVIGGFPNQDNFAAIASAYQSTGGIFRAEDLVRLAALGDGKHNAGLISRITSGHILSFQWRQSYWVPIFQFEVGGTVQKNCAREVILELADTFDDWEKMVWFVQPNAWLGGGKPLELIEHQLPAVIDAARADRFVAVG